jgi:hypothetical protein
VLFVHVLAPCFNRARSLELAPLQLSASPGCTLSLWLDHLSWCPRSVARAISVVPVPSALKTEPPSSRSAKLAGAPLLVAARACARPGPLDGDLTVRVGLDPGPRGSTRIAAPASRRHRRIVIRRIRSDPRRSNPLDLGGFAKETLRLF